MISLRKIGRKIEDVLGGVERQVNPFDHGATYANPKPQPAPQQGGNDSPYPGQRLAAPAQNGQWQTPQAPAQPAPVNRMWEQPDTPADPRSNLQKAFDQVNPLDNGRTFKDATPNNNRSVVGQLTHNGAANTAGNMLVKPAVATAALPVEATRQYVALKTGNQNARSAAIDRVQKDWQGSIPGFLTDQATNAAKTVGDAGSAIAGEVTNNPIATQHASTAGLQAFNKTVLGQAFRPAQYGFHNLMHDSAADQQATGLDTTETGAQKWFADPVMGTIASVGLAKGGIKAAERGKVAWKNREQIANDPRGFIMAQRAAKEARDKGVPFTDPTTGRQLWEGSDQNMKLQPGALKQLAKNPDKAMRLGDVIDHPDMFEAYPHYADIPVKARDMGAYASFNRDTGQLSLNPQFFKDKLETKKSIVHEVTHKTQAEEGLPLGGNEGVGKLGRDELGAQLRERSQTPAVKQFLDQSKEYIDNARQAGSTPEEMNAALKDHEASAHPEAQQFMNDLRRHKELSNMSDGELYARLHGEAFARLPESRLNLSASERRANPILDSLDVPEGQLITEHGAGQQRLQSMLDNFEFGDEMKQGKSKVSKKAKPAITPVDPGNIGGLRDQFGERMIDKDAPIINLFKRIEKATGKKGIVDKFYDLSNQQRAVPSIARHTFENSEHIQGAIKGLSKSNYKDFTKYAAARRELTYRDGMKTSMPKSELRKIVKEGHGQFKENFKSLNNYYRELAHGAKAAGIIDGKKLAQLTSSGDYIRLQRDMGDLQNMHPAAKANYSLGSTILRQKRRGSERAVLDPVHTALDYTQHIQSEIRKNQTGAHLVDTLAQHGLAKKVSAAKATNKNVISFFRGGSKQFYEVPAEIKRVADNINPNHVGSIERVVAAPGRVLRSGATALNPVFTASNIIKDQVSSAVLSKKATATHDPRNIGAGLKNSVKDFTGFEGDPLWHDYMKSGGDMTQFDLNRNVKNTGEIVDRVRGGRKVGAKQAALHLVRTAEDANAITERATRFQNFKGAYEQAIKENKPHDQALQEARLAAANNTINFNRAGTWGRGINMAIPYTNAAIQGGRQLAKRTAEDPRGTLGKGAGLVAAPVAGATIYNTSDPERKKVYDNMSPYEKASNVLFVKPGTKYGDVHGGAYSSWKIPLAPDIGSIVQPVRRGIEQARGGKKVTPQEVAGALAKPFVGPLDFTSAGGFVSSATPQAIKPFLNQAANKDFFTGKQIIPDYMKDSTSDPTQRAYKSTSTTAREISGAIKKVTGKSVEPIRIDKFATDVGGKVGSYVVNASDNAQAKLKIGRKDDKGKPIIGGQSVQAAYGRRFGQTTAIDDPTNKGRVYYKKVSDATKGLDKNEMDAYNTIHPNKVDGNRPDKTLYDASVRAGLYSKYPKVLEADNKINHSKDGDPFYSLPKEQQKVVIKLDSLSNDPSNATSKKITKDNPWLKDYYDTRSGFFDKLEKSGALKGKNGLPTPPKQTEDLKNKLDALTNLSSGADRAQYMNDNPDVQTYLDASDAYTRKKRDILGLPQFDAYPKANPGLQAKLDLYNGLPQHDGKKGGNKSRAMYIQANPEISDYFNKVSLYALGKDAELAQFEGEDWSDKTKSKVGAGGSSGSSGGSSSYSSSKSSGSSGYSKAPYDPFSNPYQFAVQANTGTATKIKAQTPRTTKIVNRKPKVAAKATYTHKAKVGRKKAQV